MSFNRPRFKSSHSRPEIRQIPEIPATTVVREKTAEIQAPPVFEKEDAETLAPVPNKEEEGF